MCPVISQYLLIFSNSPFCASAATTLLFALALMYTRSAMSGSTRWSRSPSSSEHSSLSSAIHVSSSCFLFDASTSFASSTASNALSWPRCRQIPKYCSSGGLWPGVAGTFWNRAMVSLVRSAPPDAAASSAAPLKLPAPNSASNLGITSASAPGRLPLCARDSASSGFFSWPETNGTTARSLMFISSTCPRLFTAYTPPTLGAPVAMNTGSLETLLR